MVALYDIEKAAADEMLIVELGEQGTDVTHKLGLIEWHCVQPGCVERHLGIDVRELESGERLAMIRCDLDTLDEETGVPQAHLHPAFAQSKGAPLALHVVQQGLADPNWIESLGKHHLLGRAAAEDPAHPVHDMVRQDQDARVEARQARDKIPAGRVGSKSRPAMLTVQSEMRAAAVMEEAERRGGYCAIRIAVDKPEDISELAYIGKLPRTGPRTRAERRAAARGIKKKGR